MEMGIRFVAIGDHYDSQHTEWMEQSLMLPILNLMNDAYCRDISQKVRWQQRTKRMAGDYIGAFCAYGYQKDAKNHHRLQVDPVASEVVQSIYWILSNPGAMIRRLNTEYG